ncbi:hypothetical protein MARPO_0106s0025 [Marchantia polymorpha]|uniref:Patatin n=2 Tax=Marchantia polymorpha TaxID=3197 RepID=A0A2R6WDA0_MARPO|nr:hypothetical protein MARPO_0106s0025 [Marchantia polymorpha]|eukprot:PTQ31827.1 hypothetical protein MARPO_0106s0025 [Marchantia polymorpha]
MGDPNGGASVQGEKKPSVSKVPSLIKRWRSRNKSAENGLVPASGSIPAAAAHNESVAEESPASATAAPRAAPETCTSGTLAADGQEPHCHGTPGRRLTILSLDGGGVRGLIPAVCLEFLEQQLQAFDGADARIADYFDVVAGTSTGGLIATMLTAPDVNKRPLLTATQAKQFYLDKAATIFPKPGIFSSVTSLLGPKYSASPMKKILADTLKDLKVTDSVTDLLITTFDTKTQQPVFFDKQVAQRVPRFNATLQDLCLATTAAPTFFPAHQFDVPDPDQGEGKTHQYNLIDGGVTANNPAEVAILHAVKDLCIGDSPHRGRIPEFKGYRDLLVLSLGTGSSIVSYDAKEVASWGSLSWILNDGQQPIIQMLQNSSAYLVDFDIAIRFQIDEVEENYLRLQTSGIVGDMASVDGSSKKNMQNLVDLSNKLLDEKAKYRNAINGELVDKTYLGSNRDALTTFAKWLSEEKKARAELPASVEEAAQLPRDNATPLPSIATTFV